MAENPQRLLRNAGAYRGETIDIASVLAECEEAAAQAGWQVQRLAAGSLQLPIFGRNMSPERPVVYLSAGMHGDEPAPVLAVRELLREDAWPDAFNYVLFPCLNPTGFPLNTRENAAGVDLNRQYRHPVEAQPEARVHLDWLGLQPGFDLALCLHEDWEADGFYTYELKHDAIPSLADAVFEEVGKVCPINTQSENDGMPAEGGLMRPKESPLEMKEWPEAVYLFAHKTPLCYTFETPSDYEMAVRGAGQKAAVQAALEAWAEGV